jgi:hypothetical protein
MVDVADRDAFGEGMMPDYGLTEPALVTRVVESSQGTMPGCGGGRASIKDATRNTGVQLRGGEGLFLGFIRGLVMKPTGEGQVSCCTLRY